MDNVRTRRQWLKAAGSIIALAGLPPGLRAGVAGSRELSFNHLHTGETLRVVYAEHGAYVPSALTAINHLLRDFRTGDVHVIDPRLLDVLHASSTLLGHAGTFEIISGYRSPATNDSLRRRSDGVAQRSMHLFGQAVDVRLRGARLGDLHRSALALRAGGVGYYPESDFVHLDTGRVRSW